MEKVITLGRIFFAIAMVVFGIKHFIYATFAAGLGPPWFHDICFGRILQESLLSPRV
jgi:hypothetical protein